MRYRIQTVLIALAVLFVTVIDKGSCGAPPSKTAKELSRRRVTVVLQLDRPSVKTGAFWFNVQAEGNPKVHFQTGIGNWFPRDRVTNHAALPVATKGWRFSTGVQDGAISRRDLEHFKHHIFIVDRPMFHQADGRNRERVLHIALSTDVIEPDSTILAKWNQWNKGMAPLAGAKIVASYLQAPAAADDRAAWKPLSVVERNAGEAALVVPSSLNEGLAWLRVGMSE
jgi:hypothetical protein